MEMRQVEYVLAVVDRGSFTKAAAADAREPAVAVGRHPPPRSRARRAALPPARALGRADRRRARPSSARPASSSATATPCSSRSRTCAASGRARSTSWRCRPWRPTRSARWWAGSARRTRASSCGSPRPTTSASVDAMVLDGRCELGPHRAAAAPRRAGGGRARAPGDRRGVPAADPARGARAGFPSRSSATCRS